MLFRRGTRVKRSEIPPPPCLRIRLTRIEPVLAGFELTDHVQQPATRVPLSVVPGNEERYGEATLPVAKPYELERIFAPGSDTSN